MTGWMDEGVTKAGPLNTEFQLRDPILAPLSTPNS